MRSTARHGRVFWITGYSGAGKTTIAHALQQKLPSGVLLLDGDVLRSIFGARHGFSRDDRLELAMSYAHLCREASSQGIDVICATISMFHEVRDWNREHIPQYHEIYVRVPLDERARRDPKSLYARAATGDNPDMGGIDLGLEEPAARCLNARRPKKHWLPLHAALRFPYLASATACS